MFHRFLRMVTVAKLVFSANFSRNYLLGSTIFRKILYICFQLLRQTLKTFLTI